jgi:hypothetical protein
VGKTVIGSPSESIEWGPCIADLRKHQYLRTSWERCPGRRTKISRESKVAEPLCLRNHEVKASNTSKKEFSKMRAEIALSDCGVLGPLLEKHQSEVEAIVG